MNQEDQNTAAGTACAERVSVRTNTILAHVLSISGEPEMPVRTSFELAQALNRFFSKLEDVNGAESTEM